MKYLILTAFLLFQTISLAQDNCDYSSNIADSLGTYKSTKEYMMYERNFAGNKSYIFFSLINNNGMPLLNMQTVQKSEDFIKANCMDANSKIFLQLTNGKIVTLLHTADENCGSMLRVENENKNTRVNNGTFMFLKGSIKDLKSAPVSFMKIRYAFETVDYVFKKEFVSELNNETYFPETFFMNYLKCVE